MKLCIHSSEYDPQVHTILSGPYASPSICDSNCSNYANIVPPLLSLIDSKTIFNLNDFDVSVSLQWQAFNEPLSSLNDAGSINMSANQSYDLTSLVNSVPNRKVIRARCSPLGSPIQSDYSYTNFGTVYQQFAYLNTESIVPPSLTLGNELLISNSNNFSVGVFLETPAYGYLPPNPDAYRYFNFYTISANSDIEVSRSDKYWNEANSSPKSYYRARFVKIGTGISVSTYSYNQEAL